MKMQSEGTECFICWDSDKKAALIHLGCACRSDSGAAHVECMARLARSRGTWRECPTCRRPLSGRMMHMLCGYPTMTGEAVCNIHEALCFLVGSGIVVVRAPTNDQTSFRIALHSSGYSELSIAAKIDGSGYQVALFDTAAKIAMESVRDFHKADLPMLLLHVRAILFCAACAERNFDCICSSAIAS